MGAPTYEPYRAAAAEVSPVEAHLVPPVAAHQRAPSAARPGHAPILERSAGILAFVFESEAAAHAGPQGGRGLYDRSVSFAQVYDILFLQNRRHKLIKAEYAAQGRGPGGPASVEQRAPVFGPDLGQGVEIQVLQQEDSSAFGAGVKQFIHSVAGTAAGAYIFHIGPAGGKIGRG